MAERHDWHGPEGRTVEILEQTDAYVVAVWRRVMLLVWKAQTNAEGIDRSQELFGVWAARQPGGAAFLIVLPRRQGPPDAATRDAMARAMAHPAPDLGGIATLLEAEGFIAASARAIMMRLHRGAGRTAPKVVRSIDEAAAWAKEILGDAGLDATEMAGVIRTVRELA